MTQMVTRIDDDLARAIDELVADGVVASRSDAVRRGLMTLLDDHRRRRTDEAIVAAYEHAPQTEREVGWADAATRQMIADEPW